MIVNMLVTLAVLSVLAYIASTWHDARATRRAPSLDDIIDAHTRAERNRRLPNLRDDPDKP